ncbi:MAG: prepilin-type N-terminal cleavage/methylation domain-containing protein [Collimonas sp.]|uniref:prepilin-type N-terminal cleavage/methylation domain-containing protein n=1 Tax=Collimonas sp. TaxID=1963772 RepID=UPI003263BF72
MKKHPKQQPGFLLIEVMVALLIFSFGILGLVGLQATAINNSVSAEDRTQAALLADNLVAILWSKHKLIGSSCDAVCAADAGAAKDYANWQTTVKQVLQDGNGTASAKLDPSNNSVVTVAITWTPASKGNAKGAKHTYLTEVVVQ